MVAATLDGMAAGGMYDLVGGGFHRYSVDERWLVPHFEKMLYDNALLAAAYLHAWVVTGDRALSRGRRGDGRLHAARAVLPAAVSRRRRTPTPTGSKGSRTRGPRSEACPGRAARTRSSTAARSSVESSTRSSARRLLASGAAAATRSATTRCSPRGTASLSLRTGGGGAAARAGRLARGRARVGRVLLGPLSRDDGRLSGRGATAATSGEGFLDDYANAAHGLLELHVATGEVRWLLEAHRLALLAVELFGDEEHGGFFLAPRGGEELVARTKDLHDNPIPSGNSMLAHVLLRLARIWGDDELERHAASVCSGWSSRRSVARRRRSAGCCARSTCGSRRPASSRSRAGRQRRRARRARAVRPDKVVAVGPSDLVPLLEGKGLVDGAPAVYACERFVCRAPVTEPQRSGPLVCLAWQPPS